MVKHCRYVQFLWAAVTVIIYGYWCYMMTLGSLHDKAMQPSNKLTKHVKRKCQSFSMPAVSYSETGRPGRSIIQLGDLARCPRDCVGCVRCSPGPPWSSSWWQTLDTWQPVTTGTTFHGLSSWGSTKRWYHDGTQKNVILKSLCFWKIWRSTLGECNGQKGIH